jgi:luciferase family oxidoreductase group 1
MIPMIPFSVLDLSPIKQGSDASRALRDSIDLAQHAERLGFNRFWLAEHHNMPGIASAATSILIGQVAAATSTIRVGAGGVMLPNHAPLVIAEQFGTLEALFPGRIDLGLGRAPGSDQLTARALRRSLASDPDAFPQDVIELMQYFREAEPGQAVRAVPGAGLKVPIWILGSSLFGAQLAAMLGLPYAFASHFAPGDMMAAIEVYRQRFQRSVQLERPYVMLGFNVFAADTDEEGQLLATSQQQAFVQLRTGNPSPLPPPVRNYKASLDPAARSMVERALSASAVGSPETVKREIEAFVARTGADELMITSQVFDHEARKHSFEIVSRIRGEARSRASAA